jgi:hypothetical protein
MDVAGAAASFASGRWGEGEEDRKLSDAITGSYGSRTARLRSIALPACRPAPSAFDGTGGWVILAAIEDYFSKTAASGVGPSASYC